MAVDEQARHRLHRKLEEVLGPDEAGILMDHLPPRGFGDLATKGDLELLRSALKADIDGLRVVLGGLRESTTADIGGLRESMTAGIGGLRAEFKAEHDALRHELTAQIERSVRRVIQWTSSTVLVGIGVSIAVSQLV